MRAKIPFTGSMLTVLVILLVALAVSPSILPAGSPDEAIVLSLTEPNAPATLGHRDMEIIREPLTPQMGPFAFSPHLIDRFWTADPSENLIDRIDLAALPRFTLDLVITDSSILSDEPGLFLDAESILIATLEQASINLGIALSSAPFGPAGPPMGRPK